MYIVHRIRSITLYALYKFTNYLLTYVLIHTVSGGPMYLLTSCTSTIISCDVVAPNELDAFTLK